MAEYIVYGHDGWVSSAVKGELIRCKDCKHRPYRDDDGMIDGDYVCPHLCDDPYYSVMPEDDWFCHRAERREDER